MKLTLPILFSLILVSCGTDNSESNSTVESDSLTGQTIVEEFVPMDIIMELVEESEIPAKIYYEGVLLDCHKWYDVNGDNYFVRTEQESDFEAMSEYGEVFSKAQLNAYHFIKREGESDFELTRELTDFVKECEFDVTCNFIGDMNLLDLDQDNVAELIFGYRLSCRSDVSPSEFKVVLFEEGDKYILRGESVALGHGGAFEPGDELNTAPEAFLTEMESFWNTNMIEY